MGPQIAPLPPGAAAALAVMHRACFPEDPWDAAALNLILALSDSFGFWASADAAPAGFLLARDLGGEGEILSLGVLPALRRLGIGRALVDAAVAEAQRREIGSLVLEVAIDNAAARRLYKACGFAPVGRRARYYRRAAGLTDALILRRGVTVRSAHG